MSAAPQSKVPLAHALRFIAGWTLLVAGAAYLLWGGWHYFIWRQQSDSRYMIAAILQRCHKGEPLPNRFFVETLQLSCDETVNLYKFDIEQAKNLLEKQPALEAVAVSRYPPKAILIEYSTRLPIALLADLPNIALDRYGNPFPLYPFFTPKSLPKIFIGLTEKEKELFIRGKGDKNSAFFKRITSGIELLQRYSTFFFQKDLQLIWLDLSEQNAPSLGRRQIVLGIGSLSWLNFSLSSLTQEENKAAHFIRLLPSTNIKEKLEYYLLLRSHLLCYNIHDEPSIPLTIDMRLHSLAFITLGEIL